jgi:Ca-activated chloride channel family protein
MSVSFLSHAAAVLGLHDVFIWLSQRPLVMPQLAHPLWLGLLLLPLGLLIWRLRARQKLMHYADEPLQPWALVQLSQEDARWRGRVVWLLILSFWLFLSLALADPQVPKAGNGTLTTRPPVLFLVDDSAAMSVADVSPDRQSRAVALLGLMARDLSGHRMGLMVYNDEPGLLLPPAGDAGLFGFYLKQLPTLSHPLVVPRPDRAFDWIARMPQMHGGAVVWLTSGDSASFHAALGSRQLAAAEALNKANVRLIALTVAGEGGPMRKDGLPMKNADEQVLNSHPSLERVAELARLTHGAATQTRTLPEDIAFVRQAVDAMPNRPPDKDSVKSQRSLHVLPLLLAWLSALIAAGVMLQPSLRRFRPNVHPAALGAVLMLAQTAFWAGVVTAPTDAHAADAISSSTPLAEDWLSHSADEMRVAAGNRALLRGEYAEAQVEFAAAKGFGARLGAGLAAFRRADYAFAVDQWQAAVWLASTPDQAAIASFDLGNALTLTGRYVAALDAFEHVLSIKPLAENLDEAARANREILRKILQSDVKNAKESPRFQGYQSATYGYYEEPTKGRMDKEIQKSDGATQSAAAQPASPTANSPATPFVLNEATASSARAKLNLIHDAPAPLLDGLLRQQPYHAPVLSDDVPRKQGETP